MKAFYSGRLALPYRIASKSVETLGLYARREIYPCHAAGCELPAEARVITCGVDVGEKALSYEIVAWGSNRQSWGIEADELVGNPHILPDPKYPNRSVWDILDLLVFRRLLRFEDGSFARIRMILIDCGYATPAVYAYAKTRAPRCFPAKGMGGPAKPLITTPKTRDRHINVRLIGPAGDIDFLDVLRAQFEDIAWHLVDREAGKLEGGPGVAAAVEEFVARGARFFPLVGGEASLAVVERFHLTEELLEVLPVVDRFPLRPMLASGRSWGAPGSSTSNRHRYRQDHPRRERPACPGANIRSVPSWGNRRNAEIHLPPIFASISTSGNLRPAANIFSVSSERLILVSDFFAASFVGAGIFP